MTTEDIIDIEPGPIRMPVEAPVSAPMATIPQSDPVSQLLAAAQSGADPAALEKVADVLVRMRAEDARAAWNDAFSQAQASLEPVLNDADGHNNRFATFSAVVRAVRPVCAAHGLSFTFDTEGRGEDMQMLCLLRHRSGHVETSHFPCFIDKGMKANDSQKVASASSYAKRYALLLALGVATTDELDDDAESLTETITDQQAADLISLMTEVSADHDRFLAWAGVDAVEDLPAGWFARAVKMLEAKRAQS